jgi:hypothetical protein
MRNRSWQLLVVCGLIWAVFPGALIQAQDQFSGAGPESGQFPTGTGAAPAASPGTEVNPSSSNWGSPPSGPTWVTESPGPAVYFAAEYLLAWGKGPGDNLIGAAQYRNVPFFKGHPIPFPQQFTSAFGDQLRQGVLGRLGWDNDDGSGFQFSGFDIFGDQQNKGPGRVFHGTDFQNLRTLATIPLDDGHNGAIISPQAPFDSEFLQTYDQRIIGGDIDAYLAPFFTRPSFRLRFLWGAKYLNIRENFAVQAADSGLDYVVDLNTGAIVPGTVRNIGLPTNELSISSQTTSQLIGPQIGIRYDLASGGLNIWGQSRLAVAANRENLQIAGQGVTNNFQLPAAPAGPPFQQSSSSTHVSPVFDTSLYMDFPLLSILPLINQASAFSQATFRIGYNFLVVGEIARPASIIVYKAPIPQLQSDSRTTFFLNTLSLGVNWTY